MQKAVVETSRFWFSNVMDPLCSMGVQRSRRNKQSFNKSI
jgi:hypothetical protein